MKVINEFAQGTDEWREFRRGKITGTRLRNVWAASGYLVADAKAILEEYNVVIPKGATMAVLKGLMTKEIETELWMRTWKKQPKKVGFYETIAERLSLPADDENVMDRGLRLEDEASLEFLKHYPDKVLEETGCWQSDEDARIINSPDRAIKHNDVYDEAVEIKCLNSTSHIQAIVENEIPEEYTSQVIQYFIVNPDLKTLYFVFYDPRVLSRPFHCIPVSRESFGDKIELYKKFQILQLDEMDKIVEELAW